jgi:hypothetical protein
MVRVCGEMTSTYNLVLSASLDQSQYLVKVISSALIKSCQGALRYWALIATFIAQGVRVQSNEMTMPSQELALKYSQLNKGRNSCDSEMHTTP